jgi:hypothetical protein
MHINNLRKVLVKKHKRIYYTYPNNLTHSNYHIPPCGIFRMLINGIEHGIVYNPNIDNWDIECKCTKIYCYKTFIRSFHKSTLLTNVYQTISYVVFSNCKLIHIVKAKLLKKHNCFDGEWIQEKNYIIDVYRGTCKITTRKVSRIRCDY